MAGFQARYQVYVGDVDTATEIEQYLDDNDMNASGGFRAAMLEKMERDGHFEESDREEVPASSADDNVDYSPEDES